MSLVLKFDDVESIHYVSTHNCTTVTNIGKFIDLNKLVKIKLFKDYLVTEINNGDTEFMCSKKIDPEAKKIIKYGCKNILNLLKKKSEEIKKAEELKKAQEKELAASTKRKRKNKKKKKKPVEQPEEEIVINKSYKKYFSLKYILLTHKIRGYTCKKVFLYNYHDSLIDKRRGNNIQFIKDQIEFNPEPSCLSFYNFFIINTHIYEKNAAYHLLVKHDLKKYFLKLDREKMLHLIKFIKYKNFILIKHKSTKHKINDIQFKFFDKILYLYYNNGEYKEKIFTMIFNEYYHTLLHERYMGRCESDIGAMASRYKYKNNERGIIFLNSENIDDETDAKYILYNYGTALNDNVFIPDLYSIKHNQYFNENYLCASYYGEDSDSEEYYEYDAFMRDNHYEDCLCYICRTKNPDNIYYNPNLKTFKSIKKYENYLIKKRLV